MIRIDNATPLVLEAIRCLPTSDTATPFTLADMGCADGGRTPSTARTVRLASDSAHAALRLHKAGGSEACVVHPVSPGFRPHGILPTPHQFVVVRA